MAKSKKLVGLFIGICILFIAIAGSWYLGTQNADRQGTRTSAQTIKIVMDDNYPPYVFRNAEGELQGILIDEWKLWSKKTGISVEIDAMNWLEALSGMKSGKYNVLDTTFYNEERETWLDFSEPYVTLDVPIFYNSEISGITDASSLRGFTVAVKAGDNCIPILQRYGVSQILEYSSYESIIDAAKNGTIRVFVMDEPPALYYLYKKNLSKEFVHTDALYSGQFHRAVKEGDLATLHLVQEGFAKFTAAEQKQITDKWFGRVSAQLYLPYLWRSILIAMAVVVGVVSWISLWNSRLRKEVVKKTEELVREKELLSITLQSIDDGVIATDVDGSLKLMNQTAQRLSGWGDEAIGRQFTEVLQLINENTEEAVCSPIEKVLQSGNIVGLANHTALVNREGKKIPIADGAAPIRDAQDRIYGVVMVFRDVTQEKAQREQIEHIMAHDSMTGLYNRWYMEELLKHYVQKPGTCCALIMGDLNGLKLVNDAFGHHEGDRFIQTVATILRECCGPKDIVSRWGGDEFLILMPEATAKEAEWLIDRILARCVEESDEKLQLSIALGYAMLSSENDDIQRVLREAEQWTYRRKLMIEKSFRSSVINALLSALAAKSEETEEHAERLQKYCGQIGKILGVSAKELDEMSLFAMLHDIGKVGINDAILQKPAPLTEDEWLEMRKHPEIGFRIAQNNVDLAPISEYILSHHERWDGRGYPRGVSGEEIPMLSRILAVADAYDAMTNERVYRKAASREEAAAEILRNAGTQFDPLIARLFVEQVLGIDPGSLPK
ncbi:MAG: transporter substrate-binding domain-containing protein [Eubacteriales bacterium]|nr:transporter substrate-binding domain-containing protein [Eubacteriales bacterium]